MSKSRGLDQLKELNRRLAGLLDNPQTGCFTWMEALSKTLLEMADYAGFGTVSDKIRNNSLDK